jgi:hypothetical protein
MPPGFSRAGRCSGYPRHFSLDRWASSLRVSRGLLDARAPPQLSTPPRETDASLVANQSQKVTRSNRRVRQLLRLLFATTDARAGRFARPSGDYHARRHGARPRCNWIASRGPGVGWCSPLTPARALDQSARVAAARTRLLGCGARIATWQTGQGEGS